MKLKTTKVLYLGGQVLREGQVFKTTDPHGKELLDKGYAVEDSGPSDPLVELGEHGWALDTERTAGLDSNAIVSPGQAAAQEAAAKQPRTTTARPKKSS